MATPTEQTSKAKEFLSATGLSYSYNGVEIFRDCSFTAKSKTVILRGPSGSGKTTLLKLLSGNLEPDSAIKLPQSERSLLVLQEDSLFPWLTGTQNIAVLTSMQSAKFSKHPMYELVAEFVEQKASAMSYGQRRLVELFRAIVFRPHYLYLDEPFNFLDEERIKLVLPFLRGEFMSDTNLTLSNHHKEDLSTLGPASVLHFDGNFPICSLKQTEQ
jgi:ABC-type multidrug transport system ATPase subunit